MQRWHAAVVIGLVSAVFVVAAQLPRDCNANKCIGSPKADIDAVASEFRKSKTVQVALTFANGGWNSHACRIQVDLAPPAATANERQPLTASVECVDSGDIPGAFQPIRKGDRPRTVSIRQPVSVGDEDRLRAILEDPLFWAGKTDGRDMRHGDGAIERIELTSGDKRAFMVSSANPIFETGIHQELRSILFLRIGRPVWTQLQ